MFRKPAFWILFGLVSAGAAFYAVRNFSAAFPLVSIDLRMDRRAALDAARDLARRHSWPPADFDQAASFTTDQSVQNFIELEGGGKEALRQIIADHTFAPYTWLVRNFKEGETHESAVRFTPEGEPYGFTVHIPEQEKGAALDSAEARAIAELTARDDWHADFSRYPLAESSEQVRPGGRKDHTFVYERQDIRAGEGRYRLRLVVSGDKLTELTYFLQIPEAFTRRYEEMRSANNSISIIASVGLVVYLIAFCGGGLFFLMRQRWVLWRPAFLCGVVIAALASLVEVNSWPQIWMDYDTALATSGFAAQRAALIALEFLGYTLLFSLSFVAAETISRRAFPHHIQFWNIWSKRTAGSREVLGRTMAGYLTVSLSVAYIIVFYSFMQSRFGWWSPSDSLISPDVFAAYVPSFSAIAMSAQAGFWEESLFRAVPLACFALIGDRFGKRRAFLVIGLIVQALVFGSGHAGYANQPSYARVVELIVPSFVFGGYYLAFGLLPGIVMHYTFDAVLMSLPIFAASTARAHLEQVLVIALILVPLWIVLIARVRQRKWVDLSAQERNAGWTPPAAREEPQREAAVDRTYAMDPRVARALPVIAAAALASWVAASEFKTEAPPITISRNEAERAAREAVTKQGYSIDSTWTVLSRISSQTDEDDRFVWQKRGRDGYATLVGTFIAPPRWFVRFVKFKGDVADRAEEYQVLVAGDGRAFRVRHQVPEARPGPALDQNAARSLAQTAIDERFQMSGPGISEVSAKADKRPARGDWSFEFKDTRDYGLNEGEPRIAVEIDGDQVADAHRYVHVPEEWERNERRQRNLPDIFVAMTTVFTVGIILCGAIVAAIRWSRGRGFSTRDALRIGGVVLFLNLISLPNNWRTAIAEFSTAQPYRLQAGVRVVGTLITAFVIAGSLALVAGFISKAFQDVERGSSGQRARGALPFGIAAGVILAATRTLAGLVVPSLGPSWPDYAPAGATIPILSAALAPVSTFMTQALLLSLIFYFIDTATEGWTRRLINGSSLLLMAGLLMAGTRGIETVSSWLISGVIIGAALAALYVLVLRHEPRAIIPLAATVSSLTILREGLRRAYPASLPGAVLAIAVIALLTLTVATTVFRRRRLRE